MEFKHKTVLLSETIEHLNINPNGTYVDGTAGGGGCSEKIAERLSGNGRLICLDQDPDAIAHCKKFLKRFQNVELKLSNFSNIKDVLSEMGIFHIDGAVFDLGVSSYQFDNPERGFSYNKEAKLDMRMCKSGMSAYDVVNEMDKKNLEKIIRDYGEDKSAGRIASSIVREREKNPIETTTQLAEIVKNAIPCALRRDGGHPAKRTFQALRIYVNREMDNLLIGLELAFSILKETGRIAVVTFHSIEDRIVKKKMQKWSSGCECPSDFPICVCGKKPKAKIITRKAIEPSEQEVEENPRSRSARLRVCEKL